LGTFAKRVGLTVNAIRNSTLAELDIILEAATNRRDELKAFGDAFREVLDNISPDAIYEDFSVNVPIIDEKGDRLSAVPNRSNFALGAPLLLGGLCWALILRLV